MPSVPFQTVDVFTTERFGGNPLAVITDARGLSTADMQAIAREFNYSESTFVLPPDDPANTAQIRIFTPTSEVPFAGHPNVGTAWVLASQGELFGNSIANSMVFEEAAGLVKVSVLRSGASITTAITAPEGLTTAKVPDHVDLASCISLTAADIETSGHSPVMASVGLMFAVVEVKSLDALARAKPDMAAFEAANVHLPGLPGGVAVFVYTSVGVEPGTVRARMFAPLDGVIEDPATGSASGALAALRASLLPTSDAEFEMTVLQGVEMGRPSQIDLRVTKSNRAITRVEIAGSSVPVMSGTIEI